MDTQSPLAAATTSNICPGCNQEIVGPHGECGGEGAGICMEAAYALDVAAGREPAWEGDGDAPQAALVARIVAAYDIEFEHLLVGLVDNDPLTERQRMERWLDANYQPVHGGATTHIFAGFYVDRSGTNNSGPGLDVLESSSGRMDEAGILCHCSTLTDLQTYLLQTLPARLEADGWSMDDLRLMKPHEAQVAPLRVTSIAQVDALGLPEARSVHLRRDVTERGEALVHQNWIRTNAEPDIVRVTDSGEVHYADGTFVGGPAENPY